jgi:uncharacterized protein YbjT (DUF2867 family)
MKIVVIGGTGLIGSKVVANLKQKGHEVLAAAPNTGCQHNHWRGAKGGHGSHAGGDRPRQFTLI